MQSWDKLLEGEPASDLAHHLRDEGDLEMTYTISIERGAECKAVTVLDCASVAHAIYDIETDYPGWTIVRIVEGW